jgi:transcriptional regulator with XRE-family HTH domain
MTPFGERVRALRTAKGVNQKEMAAAIGVSAAYLSALENGRRGVPTFTLVEHVIAYFNIIWDDADELRQLAARSHPRVRLETGGLSPLATAFANRLTEHIGLLDHEAVSALNAVLTDEIVRLKATPSGRDDDAP